MSRIKTTRVSFDISANLENIICSSSEGQDRIEAEIETEARANFFAKKLTETQKLLAESERRAEETAKKFAEIETKLTKSKKDLASCKKQIIEGEKKLKSSK